MHLAEETDPLPGSRKEMPDYIYLLENRLSVDQQHALHQLREVARSANTLLFLTGDAVRDLSSGHTVRELEVSVHGNALKLKKTVEMYGAGVWGEDALTRSLYLCFPGTVRVDLVSTHRIEYPHSGKPIFHFATIQDDLRRRDFTVNAMAISLNEGSFGLLMDPMNGAADIESRTLRLVSNYGFLEQPSLLIRATRYHARLGWEMDSRTRTRYEYAVEEGVIEQLSAHDRSLELEQIGHEEEGLKVLQALEVAGWMKVLFPAWTSSKADVEQLAALHELAIELLAAGVHADMSAAQMRLLTAGLSSQELAELKKLMLRPGFVEEWEGLDDLAAEFARELLAEGNATPSAGFKLFTSYDPEAVLWLGFTATDATIKEHFNLFLKVWPEARQRIPHALLQEMRITPELANYHELVQTVFLELIDGRLTTSEEVHAFLQPYSPPAPPPKEVIKRPRTKRVAEPKLKEHSFDDDDESVDDLDDEEDLDDLVEDEDEDLELSLNLPLTVLKTADVGEAEFGDEEISDEQEPVVAKSGTMSAAQPAPVSQPVVSEERDTPLAAAPVKPEKIQKPKRAAKAKPEAKSKPTAEVLAAADATLASSALPEVTETSESGKKTSSVPAAATKASKSVKLKKSAAKGEDIQDDESR
jgi:tRNA nucleotidyltransferase/poly(A) polymerase